MIAGVFVITWLAALAIWRFGQIEEKWDAAMIKGTARHQDVAEAGESSHTAAGLT